MMVKGDLDKVTREFSSSQEELRMTSFSRTYLLRRRIFHEGIKLIWRKVFKRMKELEI